jgi:hypothetical protein
MRPFTLDRPIDRLREDRTPLVAARRRASVMATLGLGLIITAVAAMVVGQRAGPEITLVAPQGGAAETQAGPTGEATGVVGAWCGSRGSGTLHYDVRFDDGTQATRRASPGSGEITVDADGPTGFGFPGMRLEFSQRADGTWSCSPRYG